VLSGERCKLHGTFCLPCGCGSSALEVRQKPYIFRMSPQQFIENSRVMFTRMRWATCVTAAALPFIYSAGMIEARAFYWAVFVAAAWLASLLWSWRRRSVKGMVVGYMMIFFGSKCAGVQDPDFPIALLISLLIQWYYLVFLFAGMPLLFFRQQLLHLARLDESTTAP